MKYAALVAGAALFLTANAFSAEILSKEDFAKVQTQYQKSGYHFLYRPDRGDACRVAKKAEVDVVVLSSGNTDKKLHVSANIYKNN
ncbi:YdgH/BhsA/McbA family protein [Raoultella planticola]|uniref:hypothetical protein n=1 Tax=Raoultella planticola TaxID=575 RepID=UPI001D0D79E4|nr:hypothetical protein [Raoultella planticola]